MKSALNVGKQVTLNVTVLIKPQQQEEEINLDCVPDVKKEIIGQMSVGLQKL